MVALFVGRRKAGQKRWWGWRRRGNRMDIPPSQTLYVQNVSDKLKKEVVKRQLYLAFSPFGRILDVVACKGDSLRGQAWVVYDSVGSATTALRSMNGFPFYGKTLKVFFAKTKSDAVALKEGSFEPRAKRQKREEKQQAKAKAVSEGGSAPRQNGTAAKELPADCSSEMLAVLFGRFNGYEEVRMVGQRGMAFIQFKDETSARTAFQAYNGFKLSQEHTLVLSYARK